MKRLLAQKAIVGVALIVVVAASAYLAREYWLPVFQYSRGAGAVPGKAAPDSTASAPSGKVLLSDQAIANLKIKAKAVQPGSFWKTIQVPGMVVDLPGLSDRGIVAPVTAVVQTIHHVPGDTVSPGEPLFTLRLLSESLHLTQTELFKSSQNIKLAQDQRKLLLAAGEGIPKANVIEVENQITRLEVAVKAYRQELLNRGLAPDDIDRVSQGKFVRDITVVAPARKAGPKSLSTAPEFKSGPTDGQPSTFEVQELKVELGQQVQAGQTLCLLSNHQRLAVEGRAFRDETPLLERSVKESWPTEVDFQEDATAGWPLLNQTFHIRYMANTIDSTNRTFAFLMPLENESRIVQQKGRTQLLWRFRPGQKVRIQVRVGKLDNVFVLPAEAVTRDGAEAYVFTQNVNTFERKSVRVLAQDRNHAVIANDGTLLPGSFVVQGAAAQLNRMAKSQSGGGAPAGYHVHADGSLHKNGDEEK